MVAFPTIGVGATVFSPDTAVYSGTSIVGPIPANSSMPYKSIRLAPATICTVATDTIAGDLHISGGTVAMLGATLLASGKLRTTGTGVLQMQAGTLTVADSAVFAGGSAAGQMTGGTLRLRGIFRQGGGNTAAFQGGASHTTVFEGASGQVVSFANPGSGAAQSRFGTLFIGRPGSLAAGITLASDIFAAGALQDTSTGPVDSIAGAGFTVTAVNLQIGSTFVFNNAQLVLNNPTTVTMFGAPGLTFRNMNTTVTQFTMNLPAGGALSLPGLNFANAPTTGLYLDFNAPSARTVSVQNSSTPFASFTASNTSHTNVTVTWPPSGLPLP
jgi:hypothetical protein